MTMSLAEVLITFISDFIKEKTRSDRKSMTLKLLRAWKQHVEKEHLDYLVEGTCEKMTSQEYYEPEMMVNAVSEYFLAFLQRFDHTAVLVQKWNTDAVNKALVKIVDEEFVECDSDEDEEEEEDEQEDDDEQEEDDDEQEDNDEEER